MYNKVGAPNTSKEINIDMKAVQEHMQNTFNIPKIELHAHIGGCLRP